MQTKACNLTEKEIKWLINHHGYSVDGEDENTIDERLERMNYLHKRLKAFKEPEVATETKAPGWGASA